MMLIILDANPQKAVNMLPKSIRFKQLIELMQLLSSCGLTNVYKKIPQGKELQEWILNNKVFTALYFENLANWCLKNVNLKSKTETDISNVWLDLMEQIDYSNEYTIDNIVFRYSQKYMSDVKSKSVLRVNLGINEYRKYCKWKIQTGSWRL